MNFYPFHIGDYASATRHLTWIEDAAYRRLLDVYYVKEGPLPKHKAKAVGSAPGKPAAVESINGAVKAAAANEAPL